MDQALESVFELSKNGYADVLDGMLKTVPHLAYTAFKGFLPLIAASSKGHAGAVKVLLKHGALVDVQDRTEESALMVAALNGHTDVLEVLLSHGASVDLVGQSNGKSALNAASGKGKLQSVKVLLDHGADIESEDINGWSPLFLAVKNEHLELVKYLLEKGANPNVKDMTGMSPLIRASSFGYTEIVEALLEGEAQVDILNDKGLSALCMASLRGHTEIVHLLLEYGSEVNLRSVQKQSALTCACSFGHTDIVWTLLNTGAKDPGLYALLTAILQDYKEIVQLFVEYGDLAHPSAVKVASSVSRDTLLKVSVALVGKFIPLSTPSQSTQQEKHLNMEEWMETHKIILETVNSLHFKSMMSRRAVMFELAPAKGKESLTLQVLLREFMLLYLAADWQTIGALLGLPAVQLRAIRNDNHLARNCMREMLEAWLKTTDPLPTWEKLVEAVEILDESKAEYLHKKFCTH